jgi:hypothetical protein
MSTKKVTKKDVPSKDKDVKEKKPKVADKVETKDKKSKEETAEEKVAVGDSSASDPINVRRYNPIPGEIYTDRILTHYDETAGIAIPRSEVDHHVRLGNVVVPLTEAYSSRYERLRTLLTSKLLPKREHLLQIFRKLKENSDEISEKCRIIEKETLSDAEQILQRLKSIVSLRQASIQQEFIHIEEELASIERVIRRVGRAELSDEIYQNALPSSSSSSSYLDNGNGIGIQLRSSTTGVHFKSVNPATAPVPGIKLPKAVLMVEIIQEFGELSSTINSTAERTVNLQVDFPTNDFPREISERLELIAKVDKFAHAMNVKDHLLWLALQDKDKLQSALHDEKQLSQGFLDELGEWTKIADQYKYQLHVALNEKAELERRNYELQQILKSHNIIYD